jgi:hypothetical protein
MAGLTNQLATALAAEVAAIAGLTTAATPVDSLPTTPFLYVGPSKGTIIGGSTEELVYMFPLHCLIGRASEDRDQYAINELLDQIIAAFRTGMYLGGLAIAELLAFDTDKFYEVDQVSCQSVDLDCRVTRITAQTYTP